MWRDGAGEQAGARPASVSGAALGLGEDLDVSPEGDWKGTQWDSSYRQITPAQGRRQEQSRGD